MKARHLARELALLTLFQLEKQGEKAPNAQSPMRELMLSAVRTLSDEAEFQIRTAAEGLAEVSRALMDYEEDHPENLELPIGEANRPVPIPSTRDMVERIEKCLLSAEYLFEALRIPEVVALSREEEVQAYAERLIQTVSENREDLDAQLNRHSEDWRVARLARMDRCLLRLAVAEMRYEPAVDLSVSINEAVELAKRFSTEESYRLINGILGAVAEELSQQPPAPIQS